MKHMPHEKYSLHPSSGVWKRNDYSGTDYTDGEAAEQELLHIIQSANDVSLFSPDLLKSCDDWVRTYHFSPTRANILRPFENTLKSAHVLEIGAGCGAITRYLGETAQRVTSIEGSLQRASIARARTRDIDSVTVIAENLFAFESAEQFDIVTSIGVFEYANVYTDAGLDGSTAFLNKANSLLKDDGVLIIAIENKLGLKYFAGAPEDHHWKEMYGIEGRYQPREPTTYGRKEIETKLKAAGFQVVDIHAAFPDYKFPATIISSHGAKVAPQLMGELAAQASLKDRQTSTPPHFAQELAWKSISDNGLLIDLANSHLIVAAKTGPTGALENKLLAEHYSTERKKSYAKVTRFVQDRDGAAIDVLVTSLSEDRDQTADDPISFHPPAKSPYVEGELISSRMRKITSIDSWQISEFASVFIEFLSLVTGIARDQISLTTPIPGTLVDAVPGNFIIDANGAGHIFDQEWTWPRNIPLGWLAFRSLLIFLQSSSIHAKPANTTEYTRKSFILQVLKNIDPKLQDNILDEYALQEAKLQSMVQARPDTEFLNWWPDSPLNCEHPNDRLQRLSHLIQQNHDLMKRLNDSRRDVEILQTSRDTTPVSAIHSGRPTSDIPSQMGNGANAVPEPEPSRYNQFLTSRFVAKLLLSRIKAKITPSFVKKALGTKLLNSSGLFDPVFYLQEYPDVANAKLDPALHYLVNGWMEGRDPSPSFSTTFYLQNNADVRLLRINPLLHYIQHGKDESRVISPSNSRKQPIAQAPGVSMQLTSAFANPYLSEIKTEVHIGFLVFSQNENFTTSLKQSFISTRNVGYTDAARQLVETSGILEPSQQSASLSEQLQSIQTSASGITLQNTAGWILVADKLATSDCSVSFDIGRATIQAQCPDILRLAAEGIDFVSIGDLEKLPQHLSVTGNCKDTLNTLIQNVLGVAPIWDKAEAPLLHSGYWISSNLFARFQKFSHKLLSSPEFLNLKRLHLEFATLQLFFIALCSKDQGRAYHLSTPDELTISPDYQQSFDFHDTIKHPSIKMLAYYLPQFHPTPENDEWHGEGFTEWNKTRTANKQFASHYQQHTPSADIGFYDLSDVTVLEKQANMLARAGMHGLIFYHYWFTGKLILEGPAKALLANPKIAINFCFCWANENWTRTWDGNEKEVLLSQDYSLDDAVRFIRYLIPFFRDKRYITIDERPVLFIYRPASIPSIQQYIDAWQRECLDAGIATPYLVSTLTRGATDPRDYKFDAAVERPLHDWTDGNVQERRSELNAYQGFVGSVLDYSEVADYYQAQDGNKEFEYFRSLVPVWDNTARYQERGLLLHNFSLRSFQTWLTTLIRDAEERLPEDRRIVVINAWNEWAEGAHLEPDLKYGYGYLNAIGRAMSNLDLNDIPTPFTTDLNPIIRIDLSEAFRNAINTSTSFALQLKQCFRESKFLGQIKFVADPNISEILTSLGLPISSSEVIHEAAQLYLNFKKPVIFGEAFLSRLVQNGLTYSHVDCHAYTVNDSDFSGTITDGEHIFHGESAVICSSIKFGESKIHRLCSDARCYLVGMGTDESAPHISTIVRFHTTGDEGSLIDAMYCLAAQQEVVVHPMLLGQDISDAQMARIRAALSVIPWKPGIKPQILNFASTKEVPDLRSKLLMEGLKNVKTQYAAFLDYDDTIFPAAYSTLISRLRQTGKAITFGRLYCSNYDGLNHTVNQRTALFTDRFTFDEFFDDNFIPLHSYVLDLKKIDLSSIVYFDFMRFMEDYFIALQIFEEEGSDWESLKHPVFAGDYNFRTSGSPNTLALTTGAQKNSVLADPHYRLCALRIDWVRRHVLATKKGVNQQPSSIPAST